MSEAWKPNLVKQKSPSDVLDYGLNWSPWLADVPPGEEADTISTSTWIIAGADTALQQANATHDETSTTVKLSAGTAGASYLVTNRIVTSGGRTIDRSFKMILAQL